MLKTLILSLFSVIILLCFLECKFSKQHQTEKEFEGIITYHEHEINNVLNLNLDDTVQLYYAHGDYVGIHSANSNKIHTVKDYYFADKSLRLFLSNTSDTLRQLPLDFPIEKLDRFEVKKTTDPILSKKCEEIDIAASYPENDSTTYSDFTFVFSRGYLPVDKEHFKNWHLGFFDKFINESGAFYLKFNVVHFDSSHKRILSSKSYDVISVKEEHVDPKMFEVDTTKIQQLM